MLTRKKKEQTDKGAILDKRRLQAVGVLLPISLKALSFLPGRHPLGRAGEGMRFLRTRPFEPGEDNPRDIDKFSSFGDYWVNESESEVQASILLLCDNSGSMAFAPKAGVRNLALLQLTYSLWRACDRVRTIIYSRDKQEEFGERNLKTQMEKLSRRLADTKWEAGLDPLDAFEAYGMGTRDANNDIVFLVSDFSPVSASEDESTAQQWRSVIRKQKGDVVPVIVSFRLASDIQGTVKLWDPERQAQRLTLLTPSRIERINQEEKERVAKVQNFFRKVGLSCLILRQERDVYPQLARLTSLRRKKGS